jgi:hypothetical protein
LFESVKWENLDLGKGIPFRYTASLAAETPLRAALKCDASALGEVARKC